MYDYKKPLYDSAKTAMEDMDLSSYRRIADCFRLLNDYRDSEVLKETCLSFPSEYFLRLIKQLEAADSTPSLKACTEEMDRLRRDVGPKTFESSEWKKRNREFAKVLKKSRRRIFRIENKKAVSWAVMAAVICLCVNINTLCITQKPAHLVFQAEKAIQTGNYTEAIEHYKDALKESIGIEKREEIEEKLKETNRQAGMEAMEQKNYYWAVRYFKDAEEPELFAEANLVYAKQLIENEDYQNALSYLADAGNTKAADDLRISLAVQLAGQEAYSDAIHALWQIEDSSCISGAPQESFQTINSESGSSDPDRPQNVSELLQALYQKINSGTDLDRPQNVSEMLQVLYQKRAETQVEAALLLQEKDADAVSKIGSVIDDVDGVLYFTHKMKEAGFQPEELYPSGAQVQNLPITFDFSKSSKDASVDLSKILPVYVYPETVSIATPFQMQAAVLQSRNIFETAGSCVKLYPHMLYLTDERFHAESLAECTSFLILQAQYLPSEPVEGVWLHTKRETGGKEKNRSLYQTYMRRDTLYLCDKNHPENIRLLDSKTSLSAASQRAANANKDNTETISAENTETDPGKKTETDSGENTEPAFQYSDEELFKTAWDLLGKKDPDWMAKALSDAAALINAQGEKGER